MNETLYTIIKLRELVKSLGYELDLGDCRNIAEAILDKAKVGTGIIDNDIAIQYFKQ